MRRAAIRVDSSCLVGSGHVMRCLVLADCLRSLGWQVTFVCRDLPGHCYAVIGERGFAHRLLPFAADRQREYASKIATDDYQVRLGVTRDEDAEDTRAVLDGQDLLVCDVYGLDAAWERRMRPYVGRLLVIDDLANREHDCDALLDHNYYRDFRTRYDGLLPRDCVTWLGPEFALVRPELYRIRAARQRCERVENVLVFIGGVDALDYSSLVLDALLRSRLQDATVNLVLGAASPHNQRVVSRFAAYDNVRIHIQPSYYPDLLRDADLAIGAGGVGMLERLIINLPSVLLCLAENQKQTCEDLARDDLAIYLEDPQRMTACLDGIDRGVLDELEQNNRHLIRTENRLSEELGRVL